MNLYSVHPGKQAHSAPTVSVKIVDLGKDYKIKLELYMKTCQWCQKLSVQQVLSITKIYFEEADSVRA